MLTHTMIRGTVRGVYPGERGSGMARIHVERGTSVIVVLCDARKTPAVGRECILWIRRAERTVIGYGDAREYDRLARARKCPACGETPCPRLRRECDRGCGRLTDEWATCETRNFCSSDCAEIPEGYRICRRDVTGAVAYYRGDDCWDYSADVAEYMSEYAARELAHRMRQRDRTHSFWSEVG